MHGHRQIDGGEVLHLHAYQGSVLNCGAVGHRVDVYPSSKPQEYACSTCGTPNPAEGHPCTPCCALCKGPHNTYSKECELKFYNPQKTTTPSKQESRQVRVSSHSRSRSRKPATSTARQPSHKLSKKSPAARPRKTLGLSNETKWPSLLKDEKF
ncbi:hypothetical protein IscW_ISCW001606 [Ixodes scapularis]|uniref:Uncharacterized protein n=1 Tax=Ixodes scapularis TaxID=6945 RepID=B7P7F9_IXOSC|nr:hypothetical protein IscW_ISCW001606 [Ixodes scapularis]|eukprot:XP_002410125.1 hypothetical protein IscW_ISCW001606 [Ixodes scapularis]